MLMRGSLYSRYWLTQRRTSGQSIENETSQYSALKGTYKQHSLFSQYSRTIAWREGRKSGSNRVLDDYSRTKNLHIWILISFDSNTRPIEVQTPFPKQTNKQTNSMEKGISHKILPQLQNSWQLTIDSKWEKVIQFFFLRMYYMES